MKDTDIKDLTIAKAGELLRSKKTSVQELVDVVTARAQKENKEVNAYLEFFDTKEQVAQAEKLFAEGRESLLTGIPVAIKDNMLMKGQISSSASKILANHRAVYDATVVSTLKRQGAIILGRTNMDEFAMGSSSETSAFGPVKNPVDRTRVPGGSSGGAAASIAMGGALGSFGSDTGGSIRQPASLCGLVGLKPTYGAVSRYGLMAMASSLDQIGPFGKTVDDADVLFRAVAGHDPMDSTSVPDDHPSRSLRSGKKPLTIGVPESFISMDGMDEDVRTLFRKRIAELKKEGCVVKSVDLPLLPRALAVYYILMPAEVSANLARFDGMRYGFSADGEDLLDVYRKSRGEGFGREVRRRILLGTYVLSAGYYDAYYNRAVAVRRMIARDLERAFRDVDVIATPTAPSPAWTIGAKSADPLAMYLEDIFTVPANIAGVPAISVPMGTVTREGKELPVGLQFMGPSFGEAILFDAARKIESLVKE